MWKICDAPATKRSSATSTTTQQVWSPVTSQMFRVVALGKVAPVILKVKGSKDIATGCIGMSKALQTELNLPANSSTYAEFFQDYLSTVEFCLVDHVCRDAEAEWIVSAAVAEIARKRLLVVQGETIELTIKDCDKPVSVRIAAMYMQRWFVCDRGVINETTTYELQKSPQQQPQQQTLPTMSETKGDTKAESKVEFKTDSVLDTDTNEIKRKGNENDLERVEYSLVTMYFAWNVESTVVASLQGRSLVLGNTYAVFVKGFGDVQVQITALRFIRAIACASGLVVTATKFRLRLSTSNPRNWLCFDELRGTEFDSAVHNSKVHQKVPTAKQHAFVPAAASRNELKDVDPADFELARAIAASLHDTGLGTAETKETTATKETKETKESMQSKQSKQSDTSDPHIVVLSGSNVDAMPSESKGDYKQASAGSAISSASPLLLGVVGFKSLFKVTDPRKVTIGSFLQAFLSQFPNYPRYSIAVMTPDKGPLFLGNDDFPSHCCVGECLKRVPDAAVWNSLLMTDKDKSIPEWCELQYPAKASACNLNWPPWSNDLVDAAIPEMMRVNSTTPLRHMLLIRRGRFPQHTLAVDRAKYIAEMKKQKDEIQAREVSIETRLTPGQTVRFWAMIKDLESHNYGILPMLDLNEFVLCVDYCMAFAP